MMRRGNEVSWTQLPIPNLEMRHSYSSLLFKKYIIMIGGVRRESVNANPFARGNFGPPVKDFVTNDVIIIDLEKNTWQKMSPNSYDLIQRYAHTACLHQDNKIIIYGGIDTITSGFGKSVLFPLNDVVEIELNDTETPEIEIKTKTLKHVDRNNFGRAYHTANIYQNQMFCFGGLVDDALSQIGTSEMSRLDLNSLEWSTCQSSGQIPEGRYGHCSALYKDKIYVLGGTIHTKYHNDLYQFDIISMNWTKITPTQGLIEPRAFRSAIESNGVIYTFGGEGPNRQANFAMGPFGGISSYNDLFTYNIIENKCENLTPSFNANQPKTMTKNGIVCHKNHLIVLGGSSNPTIYSLQINTEEPQKAEVQQEQGKSAFLGKHEDYVLQLKSLFLDDMYSDVSFKIQNEVIHAHRNILARRCKYFHNMFTSGMKESHSSVITLDEVQLTTFKALLEFVYCNEIQLDEKLALDLLELADKYSFGELKEVCGKFLGQILTLQNYVEISRAAEKFENTVLKNALLNFVTKNLRQIQQSENLGELSKSLLWEIIFKLGLK